MNAEETTCQCNGAHPAARRFLFTSKTLLAAMLGALTAAPTPAMADYQAQLYERAYKEAIERQKQENARLQRELEAKRKQLAELRARKAREEARKKEFQKLDSQANPWVK